ncbi:hypothetical protein IFM89_024196 [Coptis chinensis]|uniref:CCHC-type domain-containing protein n=1 Tax=Coptis chinensis TaxID=261450 RepID=A0A835HCU3_9MAGN|nr:hypothetical protein IFM89_024196 [Coptis chinensis]
MQTPLPGTVHMPLPGMDFFMMSYGKWKRDDFAPHFHGGGYIPQQDRAGDDAYDVIEKQRHRPRDCQENNNATAGANSNNGGYVTLDVSCTHYCGNLGHRARECTAKESANGQGEGCCNCGDFGHFARDCNNNNSGEEACVILVVGMAIWVGSVLMRTVAVLDAMVPAQVVEATATTVRRLMGTMQETVPMQLQP